MIYEFKQLHFRESEYKDISKEMEELSAQGWEIKGTYGPRAFWGEIGFWMQRPILSDSKDGEKNENN